MIYLEIGLDSPTKINNPLNVFKNKLTLPKLQKIKNKFVVTIVGT